ncbi:uncharacterized mitochondrial protein AtMg00240-like [Benincasa hispida]|uniref:uncharacterized mitochondrial protein AtMg00240-like n=1 Tax=Benincasa hispida TaxID=102211 RepID=UPI0019004ED6|nr:uncharacterized mitochondrial protein AtMg00240-like [Benincasa hispida]
MSDLKAAPLPSIMNKQLSLNSDTPLTDPLLYRSTIGALQYLTNTRPDITFMVNQLSQFLKCFTDTHWAAVKRLIRYLSGTKHYGFCIQPNSDLSISAFSNVDWAANVDDRKSIAAYCVFIGGTLVS